jgi:hypothetical protein
MSKNSDLLTRRISELGEKNDHLRGELLRHKEALAGAAESLESGELTAEAIRAGGAPEMRMDLTSALEDFEKARHQVRLALFAFLALEQEASNTEIGRSLGISRQLASRLAQEAEQADF